MPGNSTYTIDAAQTFSTVILMGCVPRTKFQSTEQETDAQGTLKWTVGAAVTFHPQNGMVAQSEVVNVTVASAANPCDGIAPGTPVTLEGFRVGVSPPELKDGKLRGGRPWYQASAVKSAQAWSGRKSDAA